MQKNITNRIAAVFIAAATSFACAIPSFSNMPVAAVDVLAPVLNDDGYYEISTMYQLYWFADLVNAGNYDVNAILTSDIVVNEDLLADDLSLNSGEWLEWNPIGRDYVSGYGEYTGTFDGNGHTISGLYIDIDSTGANGLMYTAGLFGSTDCATIENLTVTDSYIYRSETGGRYADTGFIVGDAGGTTLRNCSVYDSSIELTADAPMSDGHVGGLAGSLSFSTTTIQPSLIDNCSSVGNIINSYSGYTGGIVGSVSGANSTTSDTQYIQKSWNSSSVYGLGMVGGIAGYTTYTEIKNCYNTGTISVAQDTDAYYGAVAVAGIAGYCGDRGGNGAFNGYISKFTSCYSSGNIIGTTWENSIIGGVSGIITDPTYMEGLIVDSYYLSNTDNGIGGKTAEQFANGEVCWLMQRNNPDELIWGQELGVDEYPVLNGDFRVYQVEWDTTVHNFNLPVDDTDSDTTDDTSEDTEEASSNHFVEYTYCNGIV